MSVTPDFIGQRYKDTDTGNIWIANSTTPGDWTLEVQNYGVKWLPRNLNLIDRTWMASYSGMPGITSLTFENQILGLVSGFEKLDYDGCTDLTTLSFPNLTTIDSVEVSFINCSVLSSILFPALETTINGGKLTINSTPIVSLDLSSFTDGNISIGANSNLVSVDLSSASLLVDSIVNLANNNLTASCVNAILASCVANGCAAGAGIFLNGGTNAAPTGQGVTDKATLIAGGVSVTTN